MAKCGAPSAPPGMGSLNWLIKAAAGRDSQKSAAAPSGSGALPAYTGAQASDKISSSRTGRVWTTPALSRRCVRGEHAAPHGLGYAGMRPVMGSLKAGRLRIPQGSLDIS